MKTIIKDTYSPFSRLQISRLPISCLFIFFPLFVFAQSFPSGGFQDGGHGSGGEDQMTGIEQSLITVGSGTLLVFPNPFSASTSLKISLTNTAHIQINILDINGRMVRLLQAVKESPAGVHLIIWDGLNKQGEEVPNGIYFIQTILDDQSYIHKLIRY